jgi:hypothetical protein
VVKGLRVNSGAFVRETDETKKASHRGHGGHRGGFKIGGKRSACEQRGFCARNRRNEESIAHTEVTEGDLIKMGAKGLR